jgi:hypothetical protein
LLWCSARWCSTGSSAATSAASQGSLPPRRHALRVRWPAGRGSGYDARLGMTISWVTLGTGLVGLAAVGAATDQLLMFTKKRRLYDALLRFWLRLDNARVADLPRSAAAAVARRLYVFRRRPRGSIAWSIAISVALTASAALIGRVARSQYFGGYAMPQGTSIASATEMHITWLFHKIGIYAPAFAINWAFDLVTVIVTVFALDRFAKSRGAWRGLVWLAGTALIAYGLAVSCLAVSYAATNFARFTGGFVDTLLVANRAVSSVLTLSFDDNTAYIMDDGFFATTTMVPITAYLLVLVGLWLLKGFTTIALGAGKYGMELALEPSPTEIRDKFRPFTLLGLFLGLLGGLIKVICDLVIAFTG